MTKSSKPAEIERRRLVLDGFRLVDPCRLAKLQAAAEPDGQQWILDPYHPTGFRLIDAPGARHALDTDFLRKCDAQLRGGWPRQGPPDAVPPLTSCQLDLPDTILNLDGRIGIRAAPDVWAGWNVASFVIGDEHNAYEWSMVLADRHPRSAWWYAGEGTGVDDESRKEIRMTAISLSEKSQAIFDAIAGACKSGKITPVLATWYEKLPTDPTLWVVRRDDILKIISDLSADGEVISMLRAEREQQAEAANNQTPETAHSPTITLAETKDILKRMGPMPEGEAWATVKNQAPGMHVPRHRARDAIDALGWERRVGRPKDPRNTPR